MVKSGYFMLLLGGLLLPPIARGQSESPGVPKVGPPQHVLYGRLFRHVVACQRQAAELDGLGKKGTPLRSLYQRKAALSDANAAALISIATECEAELAGYNQRVMEIVGAARALRRQNAGGQRQAIPPAPAELTALQEKQDQAVLRARDRLEAAFGRDEFLRFEAFVQSFIAPRIRPIEAAGQTSGTHWWEEQYAAILNLVSILDDGLCVSLASACAGRWCG